LNPAHFHRRGLKDVCSTLVHEQAHLFIQHFGKPPRRGYHCRKWAELMKRVGLYPSSTEQPGGKETGYHMSHYIIEGGPFDRAYTVFERQVSAVWGDAAAASEEGDAPAPKPKRVKVVCPVCGFGTLVVPSAIDQLACIPCGDIPLGLPA
jgi:hypothetical protein